MAVVISGERTPQLLYEMECGKYRDRTEDAGHKKSITQRIIVISAMAFKKMKAVQRIQISSRCSQDNMTGLESTTNPGSSRAFKDASERNGLYVLE